MIAPDVELGQNVVIHHPDQVNLFGCKVGDNCKIASFVEIQRGVVLGRNVKIEPFVFIPTGVTIEDGVFVGLHVCFSNDRYPSAVDDKGELLRSETGRSSPRSSAGARASAPTPRSFAGSRSAKAPWSGLGPLSHTTSRPIRWWLEIRPGWSDLVLDGGAAHRCALANGSSSWLEHRSAGRAGAQVGARCPRPRYFGPAAV